MTKVIKRETSETGAFDQDVENLAAVRAPMALHIGPGTPLIRP
jgi:hypothetical protein